MRDLILELKNYLKLISGRSPDCRTLEAKALPLFLRQRFSFYRTEIFGVPWTLAVEGESWGVGSAGEYGKHGELLQPHFKAPIVFLIGKIASNTRNRLVRQGTPFIVPGTQTFLPGALIDLRERFSKFGQKARNSLSPTAQLAVLYHLGRESLEGHPLKNIAELLHCSAMMMSKVKDELETAGICKAERIGRAMTLHFPEDHQSVWDTVEPLMASPVRKVRWVYWKKPGLPAIPAGLTALSRRTMISDDEHPTYAFGPRVLERWLERGVITECPSSDEATARIEEWSYEPGLLCDDRAVDPLSLYLSLRDSVDERVGQQLEKLLQQIPW